jgi:glutamine amidotransferase
MKIAIIDYNSGNVRSVQRALQKAAQNSGFETATVEITNDPQYIREAQAVVFPGQGAAGQCMGNLLSTHLDSAVRERINSGKPFMGVCVGFQLLFTHLEENDTTGLNILPGEVRRFPQTSGLKIPQIGWNRVQQVKPSPLWENVPDGSFFYFVHSYYCAPAEGLDGSQTIGVTDYGLNFCSAAGQDNWFGVQFHPEKSGPVGLQLYANFLRYAAQC